MTAVVAAWVRACLIKRARAVTPACACVRACSLQQTYEAKRQEFLVELQRREDEMRQMFVQRVKEKEAELKDAEREVRNCCRMNHELS